MVREFLEKVLLSLLLPKPDFRLLRPKNLDFLKPSPLSRKIILSPLSSYGKMALIHF